MQPFREQSKQEIKTARNFEEDDDRFLLSLNKDPAEKPQPKRLVAAEGTELQINKNLYIEAKEIANMTEKQVKQFRKESGNIQVRGIDCPRPIQNWH